MAASQRLDTILRITLATLAVAVVAFGAYFGYTVYRDRVAAVDSSPALRVVKNLTAEVKKTPNDAVLRVRLGEAMSAAGQPQGAIEQFNAALKIDPKHTGAYLDLGLVAMRAKNYDEAKAYFNKVIDLSNNSEFEQINQRREAAFYNLGLLAIQFGKYDEAIGAFKSALRIRKDASDTYYYLARALDYNGQSDDAMVELEKGLAFDPNFPQARYFMGQLFMKKGDKVNASYQFYTAAKLKPDAKEPQDALKQFGKPSDWITKAQSQLKADDIEAALESILIARNLDPYNASAAKLHGDILVVRGNKKDALHVYREAAKLDPSNVQVKAAIKKLAPKKSVAKAK